MSHTVKLQKLILVSEIIASLRCKSNEKQLQITTNFLDQCLKGWFIQWVSTTHACANSESSYICVIYKVVTFRVSYVSYVCMRFVLLQLWSYWLRQSITVPWFGLSVSVYLVFIYNIWVIVYWYQATFLQVLHACTCDIMT